MASKRRFAVFVAALALSSAGASANWLTSIIREAGEAGSKGAAHVPTHVGPVGKAAAHLGTLKLAPKGALAAHVMPEGHWQFVNREGQIYTAGTPDELSRVGSMLVPDASDSKLVLYLTEDSVFAQPQALKQLPGNAELNLVTDGGAFPITRAGSSSDVVLRAQIAPHMTMQLADRAAFQEATSLLRHPLNRSDVRTIAFETGAAKSVSSAAARDAATKLPMIDRIAPEAIGSSFDRIRGQTALVTGRVEGGSLYVKAGGAGNTAIPLDDLVAAAERNDVNLVVLMNDSGRQAGGKNWFWQPVELGGLKEASSAGTYGQFLDTLAAARGGFDLKVSDAAQGRVRLQVLPSAEGSGVVADAATAIQDVAADAIGNLVTEGAQLYTRDRSAQSELDNRLIPGIPTYIQIPYLFGIVAGLLGWSTSRGWFARLWPIAQERSFFSRFGREISYVLAFLPIVGFPAFFWQVLVQAWTSITAPFRWFRRRFLAREA